MRVTFSTSHPIGLALQRGHLEIFNHCAARLFSHLSTGGGIKLPTEAQKHRVSIYAALIQMSASKSANRGSQRLLSQRVQGAYLEDMASLPSKRKNRLLFAETVTV